jgi:hypothetical protein
MAIVSNIRVGRPQTHPSKSAHTLGVRQDNEPGNYEKQPGNLPDNRATARRSAGINPDARDPIDPRSPNLSPD